jgi:hypothetical protein
MASGGALSPIVKNRIGTESGSEGIVPGVGKRLDGSVREDKMRVNETEWLALVVGRRS